MPKAAEISPLWFLSHSTKAVKLQPETRLYITTEKRAVVSVAKKAAASAKIAKKAKSD